MHTSIEGRNSRILPAIVPGSQGVVRLFPVHFIRGGWRIPLIAVESVGTRLRTRVQPQLASCSSTETFGSMTFILLFTPRSFGHSGKRGGSQSGRFGCFPVRGFLGLHLRCSLSQTWWSAGFAGSAPVICGRC